MYDYDVEIDYLEKRKTEYDKFLKERAIKLELNKTYLQESDTWAREHFKIIFVIERCDRYFQSSSTRNQFQRKQLNRKKYYLKDKQGE